MFKLESYITPIILSYVNRYINNFKPEDSQVSLWGGDATFHNLELNLEVLEQELQLPFSFVSGSIRELSIHVPWTKITSEPIKITINTIECILNLKGKGTRKPTKKKEKEKVQGQSKSVEAPAGYIQSLINKIVSNISIHCNNLILKYVEEDIVLSMNVKLLKFESANENWESAYTDLSPAQVILRKVITVSDLTLCLDKRNASGKIEVYQEPMLYRCSMTMHLLKHYHSATANVASTTRLDIYCNNMEFSVTEQQVPMLMRLLMLLYALQQKQLKPDSESTIDGLGNSDTKSADHQESGATWTGWAWSYVSSVLPAPWEDEWDHEDLKSHIGHTLHFGLYVDRASITFKVSESNQERAYYTHKKLRYHPMLTLDLQGIYSDTLIYGLQWFNCTGGISEASLIPAGYCSCGHVEVNESTAPYLKLGSAANLHKIDSLFDADVIENKGGRRQYNTNWDVHMTATTESVLLEKTPAFAFDYLYQLEVPSDMSSDILSELGSNYEFSNIPETSALRLCFGPFKLRVCSGLLHRLSTIQVASSFYDYPPYFTLKPDLPLQDLLPPSEDDFDSLCEFIPIRTIRVTLFAPVVELELMDHPFFQPNKSLLFKRSKKPSTANMPTSTSVLPKVTIECQFIDLAQQFPMYVNRLVHTTCQLPDPPKKLFDACYSKKSIKVVGLLSRLVTNTACHSIMLTPSSVSFNTKNILKPQYWVNCNIPHDEMVLESENITLNGTKAKMLVVYNIIEKVLLQEPDPIGKSIYSSSLLSDACKDYGFPYMEICIDGIRFKKVLTNSTQTIDGSVEAVKAFIFEPVGQKPGLKTSSNMEQVLFISGPELKVEPIKPETRRSVSEQPPLLTVTMQFPLNPDVQKHPPIFIFNLQEIRICVDPLLCKWLLYIPKSFGLSDLIDTLPLTKSKTFSEATGSIPDTSRRPSTHHLESVHSSSDQKISPRLPSEQPQKEENVDIQERIYTLLKTWFDVWKGMFLSGDVSQCTIYFPMSSLSAVGSQGIQEAIGQAMAKDNPPDILVVTLPFAKIKSAQRHNVTKFLKHLPISLPDNIWTPDKSSFPWTMSMLDLSCFTMQRGQKMVFLEPVTLNATVGLSTRPLKSSLPTACTNISDQEIKDKFSSGTNQKKDTLSQDNKRKGLKNTNASAASSSNAQYAKSNSGSGPNSPASQSKNVPMSTARPVSNPSTKVDIGYLGVCVHIDTTPIKMSTSEVQVFLFASILYGFMEVASSFLPNSSNRASAVNKPEVVAPVLVKGSSTLSPTQIKEHTLENVSDKTPPLTTTNTESSNESDSVKLTAWIQWTITRLTIELLSNQGQNDKSDQPQLMLVLDAEDIVSSLDFQSIYLKVKSKIGSASVQHYERMGSNSKWQPGAFSGVVMRLRDDLVTSQRQDDCSLVSITITRASCQHTHTLWGAVQKKSNKSEANTQLLSKSRYITEIVVNVQPLDFILSLNTLRSFYLVLMPLITIPVGNGDSGKTNVENNSNLLTRISSENLPLAYFDCQEIRVIMPSKELLGSGTFHDTLIFQLHKVVLSPQAVNPICRTPIRPDIYDQAAHARILNIPGSEVEDRQYQFDIMGISLCTGMWDDINAILMPTSDLLSNLRGTSENPALEWNILEQGQPNITPALNLRCIFDKFDVTIVAAPAMIYKDSTTICGHAVEINLVTDITVNLSLQQVKLLSSILNEVVVLVTPFIIQHFQDGILQKVQIKFPYSRFDSAASESRFDSGLQQQPRGQSKDSGIDTSDVKSVQSSKVQVVNFSSKQNTESEKQALFPRPPNTTPYIYTSVPVEVVITSGGISLTLYNMEDERNSSRYKSKKRRVSKKLHEDQGYEASEESTDDRSDSHKKYLPLLYVGFTQPNAFFAKQQLGMKFQASVFDVSFKICGPEYSAASRLPTKDDFPVELLETKRGSPIPSNGILPAFFTMRFTKGVSKHSKIELEISKPTKLLCQASKWAHLLSITEKVRDSFKGGGGSDSFMALLKAAQAQNSSDEWSVSARAMKFNDTFSKFQAIKDIFGSTNTVAIKFDQLVFAVVSENGHELRLGIRSLKSQLFLTSRPEKITLMTTFDCLTLTVIYDNFKKLLLNPWTITLDIGLYWESWQEPDSDPQVQITAESDCILLDITATQLRCVNTVLKDLQDFLALLPNVSNPPEVNAEKPADKDQHYKDDLRAGAFQFVDSSTDNADEMPLPYQVMFWTKNISSMAWKYPQPRALTKVRVFPVPYKMALSAQENISVLCHLEYWSECRNCYLPYTQFCLSESEICHLNLPKGCPRTVVASTWRVVITTIDEATEEPILNKGGISPRALAACMRIDSYFNKNLIPNIDVAVYVTKLEVSLYNYTPKDIYLKLPECLKKYSSDLNFPENQKFLTLSMDNLCSYFSTWNFKVWTAELSSSVRSSILDYSYLTEQTFIEPFTAKIELCMSDSFQVNCVSKPIQVKFGPSIAHTVAVSTLMWTQNYLSEDNQELDFIITTRHVVCNDTNVNIRLGQMGTEESILLPSRVFHLYSWKSQKKKQLFRISLEDSDWQWSKPFSVWNEGTQMIHFNSEKNFTIFMTVKNASKTQKQITFFGQLIVCNMLAEHFEMKVVEVVSDNKEQEFRVAQSHIVGGRSAAPSIFINNKKNYILRLRFYGLESSWTGDIPLREHATGSQPWLVKVPLQERGQFLSVWCRIIIQDFAKSRRILAMLWPLFMIRSNLPMSAKVHIETPTLGVHLDSVINGKGELQQLYCPGTIDHSHQITFQLEEGNSQLNNPYVPLNYTLVDQRQFFKKSPNEEIEVILESLNHCFESTWPYFDEEFGNVEWITDDNQPLTHVQVRYQNACQYSCALLVEVLPWCLMVNTLGTPVSLMLNGIELCRVQHHGIIAPPKLEESFHLGICTGNNWFFSGPLQLAKSDWSQSFYMPKITGNIPLDGTIKTCIKSDSHLCMVSLSSSITNEIRLLRLASTHVLSNHLTTQVNVMCLAVPAGIYDLPQNADKFYFTVAPHSQKSNSGTPIMQWHTLKQDLEPTNNSDYCLYIAFSLDLTLGWSCPIRVDKPLLRKAFSLQGKDFPSPVVLTAQEIKGQTFLALHSDPRPQLFIENTTNAGFYCGQSQTDDCSIVAESEQFRWNCKIPAFTNIFYNMPGISDKFPELPQMYFPEKLSFAYDSLSENHKLEWSAGVSIVNNNDLFIRVPYYGDVKLTIINTACTTYLRIESVSQVEISARDIRVRLSMREKEHTNVLSKTSKEAESFIKHTSLGTSDDSINPTSPFASENQFPVSTKPTFACLRRNSDEARVVSQTFKKLFSHTLPLQDVWESFKVNVFLESFGLVLISDMEEDVTERWELITLVCDDLAVVAVQKEQLKLKVSVSDIQVDNQLYNRASFDFPVILLGQERKPRKHQNILGIPMEVILENCEEHVLIVAEAVLESLVNQTSGVVYTGVKTLKLTVNPVSCFLEDVYVTRLMQYVKDLNMVDLVLWPKQRNDSRIGSSFVSVNVPELVAWQCAILSQPLTIRTFVINPLSMLLSVHSSMKMYIALDQSPLQFGKFERRRIFTTPYRLGHVLTMHYLSGALFGAGWVVSSLELLGSPGGLARAMGTGLRDFVSLPYRGLVQGPMAFLKGITTGSASLMKHLTAGTLQSVTKLASSVARNLDRLTLDEEHQKRTEEQRRQRPQGVAEGFMQGMTSLGISLLGAVGGIAHHPLQSMMSTGASPRSLAAGVGLGIVGMFTKPLSGAAELLALTGQGLLQGAGWNPLPDPRAPSQTIHIEHTPNSTLKYPWKFPQVLSGHILYITEATSITQDSMFTAVALILTIENLVVINLENDEIDRIMPLEEVISVPNSDPTILTLKHVPPKIVQKEKLEDELAINMDPEMRARVADYVRSTAGLLRVESEDVPSVHSGISVSPLSSPDIVDVSQGESVTLNYLVTTQKIKYFVCVLNLAGQQRSKGHFQVL